LITDNKFDFYNITQTADTKYRILDRALERIIVKRVFTLYQLAHFLIIDFEKDITKKYKSKLLVTIGDFFLLDPQISKEDKDYSCIFFYKVIKFSELCLIIRKDE
jgi:hypothetical protein